MKREFRIALLARRYRLLARRPELLAAKRTDRLARALPDDAPGPLSLLDAMLVVGAGELDRMCGYAVRVLARKGVQTTELLDVLGALDPDHICAIYYALPDARRKAITRDPVWAHHVHKIEQAMADEAGAWIEAELPPASAVSAQLAHAVFGPAPEAAAAA